MDCALGDVMTERMMFAWVRVMWPTVLRWVTKDGDATTHKIAVEFVTVMYSTSAKVNWWNVTFDGSMAGNVRW